MDGWALSGAARRWPARLPLPARSASADRSTGALASRSRRRLESGLVRPGDRAHTGRGGDVQDLAAGSLAIGITRERQAASHIEGRAAGARMRDESGRGGGFGAPARPDLIPVVSMSASTTGGVA